MKICGQDILCLYRLKEKPLTKKVKCYVVSVEWRYHIDEADVELLKYR